MDVNIEGLDRGDVLLALYEGTTELGMGALHALPPGTLTAADCRAALEQTDYTDYFHGRPIKVRLAKGTTTIDVSPYDRDSRVPGAQVIAALRSRQDGV